MERVTVEMFPWVSGGEEVAVVFAVEAEDPVIYVDSQLQSGQSFR